MKLVRSAHNSDTLILNWKDLKEIQKGVEVCYKGLNIIFLPEELTGVYKGVQDERIHKTQRASWQSMANFCPWQTPTIPAKCSASTRDYRDCEIKNCAPWHFIVNYTPELK